MSCEKALVFMGKGKVIINLAAVVKYLSQRRERKNLIGCTASQTDHVLQSGLKNWSMLSVRISSYGCRREV